MVGWWIGIWPACNIDVEELLHMRDVRYFNVGQNFAAL